MNGSVTVNADNADFRNCGMAVCTYGTVCAPNHGEISIVINNARNLTVWRDGKPINDDVRMTLNGCSSSSVSPVESIGELAMLRSDSPSPAVRSLSITLNDCAVPVNLNYKKADGAMSVTIKDSVFSSCGVTEAQSDAIAAYPAQCAL